MPEHTSFLSYLIAMFPALGENMHNFGSTFLGHKPVDSHGAGGVRLIPSSRMAAFQKPARTIPRVKEHHWDWIQAIRTGRKAAAIIE